MVIDLYRTQVIRKKDLTDKNAKCKTLNWLMANQIFFLINYCAAVTRLLPSSFRSRKVEKF
jgi:hypothetical protein